LRHTITIGSNNIKLSDYGATHSTPLLIAQRFWNIDYRLSCQRYRHMATICTTGH